METASLACLKKDVTTKTGMIHATAQLISLA